MNPTPVIALGALLPALIVLGAAALVLLLDVLDRKSVV